MGRFDGILLCSDVDGTLATGKDVPKKNIDAIEYFQSQGGLFTLATGRPVGYEQNFDIRCNAPLITDNGTRIFDPQTGRVLWQFPLDGCGMLLEWLDRASCGTVTLCFTDGYIGCVPGRVVDLFLAHKTGELLKIVCYDFPEESFACAFRDSARHAFAGRYAIYRSWNTGVEFTSPLAGKGKCLSHLRAVLGDAVHTVAVIGDYENDLSLIAEADRSFAPANACPEVVAAVNTVLSPCQEGAVAELVQLLDRECR